MKFEFSSSKPNAVAVTELLLKQLNVKVSISAITQNIDNHPNNLSIVAIADCLTAFQVENYTYNVKNED